MLAYAEEGVALCREQNFALWLGGARAQRGWALVELGHIEEGVNEIRRGINDRLATDRRPIAQGVPRSILTGLRPRPARRGTASRSGRQRGDDNSAGCFA
jgi:hypothetical protein